MLLGSVEDLEQNALDVFIRHRVGSLQFSKHRSCGVDHSPFDLLKRDSSALHDRRKVVVERGLHDTSSLGDPAGGENVRIDDHLDSCVE